MRVALVAPLAVLTLGLAVHPAFSSPYKQADAYFEVRDRATQVVDHFASEELQTQPQKFAGKLVEVRGMINAVAGSETQTTLLVGGTEGTQPIAVTLPPGKPLADWPGLDVGMSVRLLCHVVTLAGSGGSALEVRIAVKEYEASAIDASRAKAVKLKEDQKRQAEALHQRSQPIMRSASRGVTGSLYNQAVGERMSHNEVLARYTEAVRYFNHRIGGDEARSIAEAIIDHSVRYGLDARLVMAVIACESNFNANAVSSAGARGLGQLMPGTASGLGVGNSFDPYQNLEGSTRLLSHHIQNMSPDGRVTEEAIKLALACYNAGAGAVKKYRGIPPYRETQNYVKKITRLYRQFRGQPG
jgi:soluble lytic murein transglycosylase-like protein